jgi:hypothetical protein
MDPVASIKARLLEIATAATTTAEALDAGRCDYLDPEVRRPAGALDVVGERLQVLLARLAPVTIPCRRAVGAETPRPSSEYQETGCVTLPVTPPKAREPPGNRPAKASAL